jgi:ubiquinone/menaquinone biosynthesis C-methylase UbiE
MCFYGERILPHLTDWSCGLPRVTAQRRKVVPLAHGEVLEVGIGSGLNLPVYDAGRVKRLTGVDPSGALLGRARQRAAGLAFPVRLLRAGAEALPLDARSVDDVVVTYSLCSIPALEQALEELRRVLKPGGRLLFCEHGLAPEASVQRWQRRIAPLWRPLAGGCDLTRDAPALLERWNFRVEQLERFYLPGTPRLVGYHSIGIARPH